MIDTVVIKNKKLKSRLYDVISNSIGIPVEQIDETLSYQDINEWSSLSHINLMSDLEKVFEININEEQLLRLTSVSNILSYLEKITIEPSTNIENRRVYNYIPSAASSHTLQEDSITHPPSHRTQLEDNRGDTLSDERALPNINSSSIQVDKETLPTKQSIRSAELGPETEKVLHRGLNNIYFDESSICLIEGQRGELYYRGHPIDAIAEGRSFEELVQLLLFQSIEDGNTDRKIKDIINNNHELSIRTKYLIEDLTKSKVPLDSIILIAIQLLKEEINQEDTLQEQAIKYISLLPSILGKYISTMLNKENIVKRKDSSYSEYYLSMILQKEPPREFINIFQQNMILQAEHGANASTFAARISASTKSDLGNCLTAAISVFQGSLHGGAIIEVVSMIEEIKTIENVEEYIENRIKNNLPVYGFGHRVYKKTDPRAKILRASAIALSNKLNNMRWINILEEINQKMNKYEKFGLAPNVDFYACVSYMLMGISKDLLLPIFTINRTIGWLTHIIEQYENNILIRPRLKYKGEIQSL